MPVSRPDNPFHFFLKLPPEVAAPDHYQLLGLPQFTDDRAAIKSAALERNRELRGWDNSDFHIWSNELLDEVVAALIVLESPAAKAEYDRQLREASDRAAPPHHAAPPSRTVANGIRELRRVLAGITPPITATPPTASSNSSDSAVGRGITGTEQTNDKTDEQPFASVGENEVYFEAASNDNPRTLPNSFWRQAPLRNMFAGLLIVVAIAGWWWLMPRYGWVVMLGTDNDLDLFVDGKPITSQHRGQFLHLTAGSHSLVTKSGDETIETHQIDVTSSGPPLVVELKRFRPPVVKSPISAEQAHQLQSAWARHLKVPVQFENSVGMKFQFVPPGEFKMGTDNLGDESPRHTVQLAQPFYFGTHEVTQANYEAVMGNMTNPIIPGEQDHPVTRVSWDNANQLCEKLSNQPDQKSARRIYRLPTEAEWEYACRAGTESAWSFGDDPQQLSEYGWYQSHSNGKTHPFGKLKPNPWGLFDLHGNVSEWCQDWYESSYYRSSPFANPSGPAKQTIFSTRVCRGGSWDSQPNNLRSAFREANSPTIRDSPRVGFRVVLEVDLNSMGILAGPVSEWTTSQSAKSTTTPDTVPKTDYDAIAPGKWVRLVDASTPLPDSKKMKFTDGVLELNATILEFK